MVKSKDGKTEIISKEEKFWRDVKETAEDNIKEFNDGIKTRKRMIKASEIMIKIEKDKS